MYLEKILGTSTKIRVLSIMVGAPEKSYMEKDLAKAAGAATSEINRQMSDLVGGGLVRLERVGKTKIYSLNKRHFLIPSLKRLFRDLNAVYGDAASRLSKFAASSSNDVEAVLLIGSVARGKVKSDIVESPSDIDLVFILKNKKGKEKLFNSLISYINKEISLVYGIVCYPIVMSKNEYIEALKNKDEFILRVQSEGVELYGRKPRRFG